MEIKKQNKTKQEATCKDVSGSEDAAMWTVLGELGDIVGGDRHQASPPSRREGLTIVCF